jgi:hypothetical protein
MPAGYTEKRRVGLVYNDTAGDLVEFIAQRHGDGVGTLILLCGSGTRAVNLLPIADYLSSGVAEVVAKDKAGTATASPITITPDGVQTIDGAASLSVNANYAAVSLVGSGTDWSIT